MLRRTRLVVLSVSLLAVLGCSGGDTSDAFRQGRSIYADTCSVCHGDRGQGQVGPPLDVVLTTWPDCDGHVEWIEVGSEGWVERYGDRYGATQKQVEGGMPAHAGRLTLDEMRLVALFERVAYGGQAEDDAREACQVSE